MSPTGAKHNTDFECRKQKNDRKMNILYCLFLLKVICCLFVGKSICFFLTGSVTICT